MIYEKTETCGPDNHWKTRENKKEGETIILPAHTEEKNNRSNYQGLDKMEMCDCQHVQEWHLMNK